MLYRLSYRLTGTALRCGSGYRLQAVKSTIKAADGTGLVGYDATGRMEMMRSGSCTTPL
ncbi:hypothetical protein AA12717_2248 [Gluconacetobacter sacchari DSM 12717]|uniref:YD repeat-containing protein n=1 Tax=Gluconacetobacter sacchari DSM 12717 TaxID=1307940 RepID=A0ABQ0P7Y5_9PROT|nr:hypothetical protein AA12717_2248 [Gluconacetobacter sacchari DSM 12717]